MTTERKVVAFSSTAGTIEGHENDRQFGYLRLDILVVLKYLNIDFEFYFVREM